MTQPTALADAVFPSALGRSGVDFVGRPPAPSCGRLCAAHLREMPQAEESVLYFEVIG